MEALVAGTGFEPVTLAYETKLVTITINPHNVEITGIEPVTSWLQTKCSPN